MGRNFSVVLLSMLLFQGCSKSGFAEKPEEEMAAIDSFGEAPIETHEEQGDQICVPGQKLQIYMDPNNSGMVRAQNYLGSIVSFEGFRSHRENYNYYSESAHPIVGPRPEGFGANIFFYDNGSSLSLNFFANIDEGGSSYNTIHVDVQVSNNSMNDSVILSDDHGEINEVSPSYYQGRFEYWYNTDGGVIGPIDRNSDFKIHVRFKESGDVQRANFYSSDGNSFSLIDGSEDIHSFILLNASYEDCVTQ